MMRASMHTATLPSKLAVPGAKPRPSAVFIRRAVPAGQPKQRASLSVVCGQRKEDVAKERSRQFRRVIYDHGRWKKHRSADRHMESVSSMLTSRILRSIGRPILWVFMVSAAVCGINHAMAAGMIPSPNIPLLSGWLNPLVLNLTAGVMSLLLVFRTNSCYGRFDEARKMIGGTLNRCRDIARQVTTNFPTGYEPHAAAVCQWLVAYVRAIRCHLQNEGDLEADLKDIMHPTDLKTLLNAPHRPVMALQMLSGIIAKVKLDNATALQLGQNITFFHDQLGGSERILRTPIPLSYTRHTERFMLIWLTLVPFGLYPTYGWATIPLSCLIAMVFLAIDEIAIEIEEPFGMLPLAAIGDVIQRDVLNQLKDGPTVASVLKERGFDVAPAPAPVPSPNGISAMSPALAN